VQALLISPVPPIKSTFIVDLLSVAGFWLVTILMQNSDSRSYHARLPRYLSAAICVAFV